MQYIAVEDFMALLGASAQDYEESVRNSLRDDKLGLHRRITYNEFLLIMKGQTNDESTKQTSAALQFHANGIEMKLSSENVTEQTEGDLIDPSGSVVGELCRRVRSLPAKGYQANIVGKEKVVTSSSDLDRAHLHLRLAVVEAVLLGFFDQMSSCAPGAGVTDNATDTQYQPEADLVAIG